MVGHENNQVVFFRLLLKVAMFEPPIYKNEVNE